MYLTKFQEADWLSRRQFQRQFRKTKAISDSKLGPKLKYFCDWSIEQGQNFEPIKITEFEQVWAGISCFGSGLLSFFSLQNG